ncbi:methyltransferase domain-containing protein [Bradyrhizobium sp. CCBAU 45389]|uniref:methyltransferase domain-containing protein n=1 Tax=Bradyrhizobium sp. CCBAU 45389 TaxID=858429 RepID=UPI002304DB78|nr:methyltransferase domain-containing protein [Bradyrhizobium sp. CCBAU 45389]MDA9399498.1 SAM-dependent methyltransferase [Bradyrhizobium sp. CCBAU 45389]
MASRDPGSFRDPSATVFASGGAILRSVNGEAERNFLLLKSSGAYDDLLGRGWIIGAEEVDAAVLTDMPEPARGTRVLVHPRLPFISYPYEWPFALLKRAALLHLDVQLRALDFGFTLSDASAYNVQFAGHRPVFIDISSFVPYRDGDYWTGQRQFIEQFVNPLLLRALFGIAHNSWYRGALEGIASRDIVALLGRFRRWLAPDILTNITLPDLMQRRARHAPDATTRPARPLPKAALQLLLRRLHRWISKLAPKAIAPTEWQRYETDNVSYAGDEERRKRDFVADFARRHAPASAWDIGCNTGRYAEALLQNGAKSVIGFDADLDALEGAAARAAAGRLDFLPLFSDAANPSPAQGWAEAERTGLSSRRNADAVIALALVHHLAIGRNVPLPFVAEWLVGLAPRGVIEFVPKADPMVQRMLRLRRDIFADYDSGQFEQALGRHARIVRRLELAAGGRALYEFERVAG